MVCVGLACLYLALDGLATGSVTAASRYILNPTSSTAQPLRYWFDELFWFGLGIYLVLWPVFRSRCQR